MKKDEHKQRHIELHKALDELFADYITHHPGKSRFTKVTIGELLEWTYEQTINPTE